MIKKACPVVVVVHIFNPSTQEVEAGGALWVQGQPDLQNKFQGRQGHTEKPCPEKLKKERKKGRKRKEGRTKERKRKRKKKKERLLSSHYSLGCPEIHIYHRLALNLG